VGIVVDDSIIIAENMHRHFKMKRLPFKQAAIFAINEVGNPTILATFTVIAAILPMAFVSGMMGPYMSPMPIGASIAMLLSLFVALTVTPYLGYHLLHEKEEQEHKAEQGLETSWIYKIYNKLERPFLESTFKRNTMLIVTVVLLFGSVAMFFTKSVLVKSKFDNSIFKNTNFILTNLSNVIFEYSKFRACIFENTIFKDTIFIKCDFEDTDFQIINNLKNCTFVNCNFGTNCKNFESIEIHNEYNLNIISAITNQEHVNASKNLFNKKQNNKINNSKTQLLTKDHLVLANIRKMGYDILQENLHKHLLKEIYNTVLNNRGIFNQNSIVDIISTRINNLSRGKIKSVLFIAKKSNAIFLDENDNFILNSLSENDFIETCENYINNIIDSQDATRININKIIKKDF
jgi:hypothetical protein